MNRRSFLTLSGLLSGATLIPAGLARRIHETCIGNRQPLLITPHSATGILYAAQSYGGEFMLHLGDPREEPEYPTLLEFIEDQGFNPENDDSLREYLVEWGYCESEIDEEAEGAICNLEKKLHEPINGSERDHWLDWDFERRYSPMACAFHYLNRLPLDGGCAGGGLELGELSFVEGDRPGSNLTYVEAADLATLACLQHRLNELKTGTKIEIL